MGGRGGGGSASRVERGRERAAFDTPDDELAWFNQFGEQFENWKDNLSADEKHAIYEYTGPAYTSINPALYADKQVSDVVKGWINSLDSALGRSGLSKNTILYRSLGSGALGPLQELLSKNPQALIGKSFTNKGFSSMTVSKSFGQGWSGNIKLIVRGKAGLKGGYVSHRGKSGKALSDQGSGEREFLGARNLKYTIRAVRQNNNLGMKQDGITTIVVDVN